MARRGDALGAVACAEERFGFEDLGELGEFEAVDLAEVEGGERGVEEVFEEFVGELGGELGGRRSGLGRRKTLTPGEREDGFVMLCGVGCHACIFAQRADGTREIWWSA